MKRQSIVVLTLLLTALILMTWNFATSASADKDERGYSSAVKPDVSLGATANSVFQTLPDAGEAAKALRSANSVEGEEDDDIPAQCNPDRPAKRSGPELDEDEYLRLRDQHIARLRGLDLEQPLDVSSRRSEAILLMDEQQKNQRAQTSNRNAPDAFPTWTELGPKSLLNGQSQQFPTPTAVTGRATAVVVDPTNSNKV